MSTSSSKSADRSWITRIWRSPWSDFHLFGDEDGDESLRAADTYTQQELAKIADAGFTAIWVHVRLDRAAESAVFPEFGRRAGEHTDALRRLVRGAATVGLEVFAYVQPARSYPADDAFWGRHPEVRGGTAMFDAPPYEDTPFRALCTSVEMTRDFVREAVDRLVSSVPELAGLVLITASEAPSHCYGRAQRGEDGVVPTDCPRCAQRSPTDVVAELIATVVDGVAGRVRVVAWNWSWVWFEPGASPSILEALPDAVEVMADFERGGRLITAGVQREIDEYSLSYAGPSRRYVSTARIAAESGHPVLAKLQLSTTHELASVPSLPVLGTIYEKAVGFAASPATGFLGCWNMGNAISLNARAFNFFLDEGPFVDRDDALRAVASHFLPGADARRLVSAWDGFAQAIAEYPFSVPFLYHSPLNYVLALPLKPGPLTGTPVGDSWIDMPRGDDLSKSLAGLSPATVAEHLERLSAKWTDAADNFAVAIESVTPEGISLAKGELASIRAAEAAFASGANCYRLFELRQDWDDRVETWAAYRSYLAYEVEILERVLPWLDFPEVGWHAEAQAWMFDSAQVGAKLEDLRGQLEKHNSQLFDI